MSGVNFTGSRLYLEVDGVHNMTSVFKDTSDADAADDHNSFVFHKRSLEGRSCNHYRKRYSQFPEDEIEGEHVEQRESLQRVSRLLSDCLQLNNCCRSLILCTCS